MRARASRKRSRSIWASWLAAVSWTTLCVAGEPSAGPEAAKIDYARQVKPILTRHCVACHGAARPRAGLRLDTAAAALKGGKNGPVILPGQGEESPLILAVRGEGAGERMPLKRPPLCEAEIDLLRGWIDQGARGMADEPPGVPPAASHWAFVPPRRPEVPEVRGKTWVRNPIDRFILARLEQGGLSPSPEAEPDGPAAPGQPRPDRPAPDSRGGQPSWPIDRRIATSAPSIACWPRPISASAGHAPGSTRPATPIPTATASTPRARSGSTATGSSPPSTPTCRSTSSRSTRSPATCARAPPWRQQIATGFHRNTPINQEGGIDVEQFRVESIVDRVNTTGTVFLGLTIGCAQCHDHKYDPISQRDYYRLFAFFNNVDEPDLEIADAGRNWPVAGRSGHASIDFHQRAGRGAIPDLDERERDGRRRWRSTSRRTQTPRSSWRSTCRGRSGRRPSGAVLVELMIAARPGVPGRAAPS